MNARLQIAFFVAVGAVSLAAAPVHAQEVDPDARARLHFQAGEDLFRHGEYEGALREFTLSYETSGRPQLLYNIGSCHERLGHYGEAADNFDRYLAEATDPTEPTALAERSRRLRARAVGATTAAPPNEPDVVNSSDPDPEATVPTTPRAARASGGIHPAAWVVLGVGAAGLVTFAVLGGLALAEDSALASECGTACSPSRAANLETLGVGADVALGVGLGLVAVGVVLALVLPADAPTVEVQAGTTGATLSVATRF